MKAISAYEFHPLTLEHWGDFEKLFGIRGACGGCWCMWWHLTRKEFDANKGAGNKRAMKARLRRGETPGILAYRDGLPMGWCAVGPRSSFSALERSRILKPVDEEPVWSLLCFYVEKSARRSGLSVALIESAKQFMLDAGGRILEAYPVEPCKGSMPDAFAFQGLASAFRRAGFQEVARRSPTRPIMRWSKEAP